MAYYKQSYHTLVKSIHRAVERPVKSMNRVEIQ